MARAKSKGRPKAASGQRLQPAADSKNGSVSNGNRAELGFEAKMWAAADMLRGAMDASEYKHVVLGLIFLKYISDSFEEHHRRLHDDLQSDPEDRDEYVAHNNGHLGWP
jgi:type I restriction enzyme M protein